MTASFEQLIAEHDDIDARAAAILAMARSDGDARAIAGALDELAGVVDAHLAAEDGLVYPIASAFRARDHEAEVAEMTEQLAALRVDWRGYLSGWTAARIEADPAGFRAQTETIVARLRERVRVETAMLYPEALRLGVIRLRA